MKQQKRLYSILLAAAALLLIPFIAMQFTHEINWSLFDFLVAGVLLSGAGLACELILRKVKQTRVRILLCSSALLLLLLIWAELAVGIFGSPIAGH